MIELSNDSQAGIPVDEVGEIILTDLDWLRTQLARHSYRPGWTMSIGTRHDGTHEFRFRYTVFDSRNPDTECTLQSRYFLNTDLIAAHRDPEFAFTEELRRTLEDIELHESREFLRRDGVIVNDPHADATRWQCACGAVGPTRRDASWICPSCGKEHKP